MKPIAKAVLMLIIGTVWFLGFGETAVHAEEWTVEERQAFVDMLNDEGAEKPRPCRVTPRGYPLADYLDEITSVECRKPVKLEHFPRLENLDGLILAHADLRDIAQITAIPKLKKLVLRDNYHLLHLPHLDMPNLRELDLSKTYISDLEGIRNLPCLEVLRIGGNYIDSLEPLAEMASLRGIYASSNVITDVSYLSPSYVCCLRMK